MLDALSIINGIIMPYDLGRQYEIWDCPFCGQDTISIIHFPKCVSVKRSRTVTFV